MKILHTIITGVLLSACFLFVPSAWTEPYRPSAERDRVKRVWDRETARLLEVTGGVYYRFTGIETAQGKKLSGNDWAFNGAGGIWVTQWLMLGAEAGKLQTGEQDLLKDLEMSEAGGLVKLNLTPQTSPRQYLLLGYGKRKWEYEAALVGKQEGKTRYFRIGIGIEGELAERLLGGIEWRATYLDERQMGNYIKASKRWEHSVGIRLGLLF